MQCVNLRRLPQPIANVITDANEGVVDALLNLTWERVSGSGPEGEVVYGTKPSLRFVSGFLLPRYEESGQEDETSDIHVSTHGLDCQILDQPGGTLEVGVEFSIYIRSLPEWHELTDDLFPRPTLRKDIEDAIRATTIDRLSAAKDAEREKPRDQQRTHRQLQQEIYRQLLGEHGVRISSGIVADAIGVDDDDMEPGEPTGGADEEPGDVQARLDVRGGGYYIFDNDLAAKEIDLPQKWRRLSVRLEAFRAELSDQDALALAADAWSRQMRIAIDNTVANWIASEQGAREAYRPGTLRPSNFRDASAWNTFLDRLRQTAPRLTDVAPRLDQVTLTVALNRDLRDSRRLNLRVLLENNGRDVKKRKREQFEHAIHQVKVTASLPVNRHVPLRLDRVEPSYRFRDFLSYPAIGINCGVSERRANDRVELATAWMPRYQQPRIVPNDIEGVPVSFEGLMQSDFNPSSLRYLIDAYREWVSGEEMTIDPAAGVVDDDEAERERSRFREDIRNYRLEIDRIALGIELLSLSANSYRAAPGSREALPYRAWLLLNETFYYAGRARGISGWRLFQLAFVLAHIPTIASRMPEFAKTPWFDPHFDEETATLLYFPTGGGKSEAFFGLVVFNMFLDRLRGKGVGVTALIRYPLRLLTLQQAQRLLVLVVRAELIRRSRGIDGHPFEIGFWVGNNNTPNNPDDKRLDPVPAHGDPKHANDDNSNPDYDQVNNSFNKIPNCPTCGDRTGLRRISGAMSDEIGIFCFNNECEWNRETRNAQLPFLIVDRDIYRHAPSVLLGVIDKLALIGQHPATIGRVMGMFGLAKWMERRTGRLESPLRQMLTEGAAARGCDEIAPAFENGREVFIDPFPSLIIQDEAHLLEESLGTFAGLFETMLEQLFVRAAQLLGNRVARSPFGSHPPRLPKVVAATATVSVPQQQFGALYQRRHMHFPYPGTSIYRSFYAQPAVPANRARVGLGGGRPSAPEVEAPWMRVYASIMTNGRNHTVTTVSMLAAYHLAITELWRDLSDDQRRNAAVHVLLRCLSVDSPLRPFHEAAIRECDRADDSILPTILDLMRISLTYVTNKKGGDQVIDAFREEVVKVHRRHGRTLTQFHTELISGGIDVAEIQAIMRQAEGTCRPGDPFPDLEQSLRNIVATSAISHGVDVDQFNAMFFAGMPNDIAEFIQASSRVGRTYVGFSLIIPTPHARRDRYIVETHDIFHRFLERMIAPPAITRWATSAHERVITSLFQAWLCGWAEPKLFIDEPQATKARAQTFETVNDVNRVLTGNLLPGAARDFMEFAVLALGVSGRGVERIGAAPHGEYYEGLIRDLARSLTDELRVNYTTERLQDYWQNTPVGQPPMMSLRDIDEAGGFFPATPFGSSRARNDDDHAAVRLALRIVRRQSGRVSELDFDEDGGQR